MRLLTEELRTQHSFTTASSPWANGTVERVCRELIRACKALLSEWKLSAKDWPSATEAVQSVISHAPLKLPGLRKKSAASIYPTLLGVFTGHVSLRPLLRALPMSASPQAVVGCEARVLAPNGIQRVQSAVCEMQKEAEKLTRRPRRKQIDRPNRQTNIQLYSFREVDFAFVRRMQPGGHKLDLFWQGPRQITLIRSEWVCEVQDLLTGKHEAVHACHIILYKANMDGKVASLALLEAAKHS